MASNKMVLYPGSDIFEMVEKEPQRKGVVLTWGMKL